MHGKDGVPTLLGGPNSGVAKSGLYYRCIEAVSVGGCNPRELVKPLTELEMSGGSQGDVYQHIYTDCKGIPTRTEMIYDVTGFAHNNTPWQYGEGGGDFYRRLARVVYNCKYGDGVDTYKRFKVIETPEMMLPPLAQTALTSEGDCTGIDRHHIVLPMDGNTIPVKGLGANGGVKITELDCSRVLGIQAGIGLHLGTSGESTESQDKNFPSVPMCQQVSIPVEMVKVDKMSPKHQELRLEVMRRSCNYWDYDINLKAVGCLGDNTLVIPYTDAEVDVKGCVPMYVCNDNTLKLEYTCWFTTSDNSGHSLDRLNINENLLNSHIKCMIQAGCNVCIYKSDNKITINVPNIGCNGQGIGCINLYGYNGLSVENKTLVNGVYSANIYGTLYCFDDWFCVSNESRKKTISLNASKIQQFIMCNVLQYLQCF